MGQFAQDNLRVRSSKTHSLLVVETSEDFLQLVTGIHPEYPHQRTNHLVESTPISKNVRWLLNPKNRAIRVDLRQKYENSSSGYTRVIDHDNKEIAIAIDDIATGDVDALDVRSGRGWYMKNAV